MNIAIIGLGLIGGSIARCLRKMEKHVYIRGLDQNSTQMHLAQSLGIIDQPCSTIDELVEDADLVLLCTPVQTLCSLLKPVMLSPSLKDGAIITDVGSTKTTVVQKGTEYQQQSNGWFIGGHPMAGSHKSGVQAAHDRLFENAYYVLTPPDEIPQSLVDKLRDWLAYTKAKVVTMPAEEHDRVVGAISHFPHIIASALVEQVGDYHAHNDWYLRLAAGGFRDITRIASSNPRMWRDIMLHNRSVLVDQMEDWLSRMEHVRQLIVNGDAEALEHFFDHAKQVRDHMPEGKRGAIPAFYDIFVDVPDHPGIIGEITTLLGEARISITNIQILEAREDILGVLRLSFRNEDDRARATELIRSRHYAVYPPEATHQSR